MSDTDFGSRNPFGAYCLNPTGVTFENQEKGEKIILLLRADVVTLIPQILFTILLLFVPLFVNPALLLLKIDLAGSLGAKQVFFINVFWYLFVFGFAFYRFISWYFNIYLLTNERIIDFDFYGVLSKKISYARLAQIEDVTPKTVGFGGTFFNYGSVFIQTAGERPEFEFERVARPDLVAERIFNQVNHEEVEKPGEIS